MGEVDRLLRRALTGKARRYTGITLMCALLLLLAIPAADEYLALRKQMGGMELELQSAVSHAHGLPELRKRTTDAEASLARHEQCSLTEDQVHDFRSQLVELTRNTGCQLRRIQFGTPEFRPWTDQDHPLVNRVGQKNNKLNSPYRLRIQSVTLSVTGELEQVKTLLKNFESAGKVAHTSTMAIRPLGGRNKQVSLEVEWQIFGIENAPREAKLAV